MNETAYRKREYGVLTLIVLAWFLVTASLAAGFREIRLSDVPGFIARAYHFDVASLESLVDPYYPCGYPLALRVLGEPMADYHRAAQLLSLAGAALTLAAVWVIGRVGFGWDVACAATLLVGTHYEFNLWAIAGTTDTPALGWMYAAIAAFAVYSARRTRARALAGGMLVGIGYLVRYSALTILPVGLLWLLTRGSIRIRTRLDHAAVCLAGFLLAAAPQLIPTALQHGNPFWNRQDSNVYFGMFGGMNWARGWQEATAYAGGLGGIVRAHPREFVANIGRNAARVASEYDVLPAVLAVPGTLLALRTRGARPTALLVLAAALTYGLALCMTFITRRLMLPLWPALMVFAAYAMIQIRPRHVRVGPLRLPFPLAVLALVVCYVGLRDAVRLRDWLAPTDLTGVTDALRRHGMSRGDEVLSFDFPYYYVGSKLAEPFPKPWYFPQKDLRLHTTADVVALMRREGMRFLVFNDNLRKNAPRLADAWPDAQVPPEFTEVYSHPRAPHARVWHLAAATGECRLATRRIQLWRGSRAAPRVFLGPRASDRPDPPASRAVRLCEALAHAVIVSHVVTVQGEPPIARLAVAAPEQATRLAAGAAGAATQIGPGITVADRPHD
jgi:hypothetical protein